MVSSRAHTLVRVLQLSTATAIVITAAFLLVYRTRLHTNFSNEPLASCISGAVAFIYASWALMNHRRQPDSDRWIYLHGFWCFLVCGLLIAGSTLAFVLGQQGAPCLWIRDSRNMLKSTTRSGSSATAGHGDTNFDDLINVNAAGLPTYQDGVQYAPGQHCKNDHYQLNKACAILGAVAAGLWLIDFFLIFGLCCGSSGQYGPYRRNEHEGIHRRRNNSSNTMGKPRGGQVGVERYMTEEEDYYPAGGYPPPQPSLRMSDMNGDEYYWDALEQQRKRGLEWRENRTLDDPKGHVQGPIPMSMQQSYYATAYPNNVVIVREAMTTAEGVLSPPVKMVIWDDFPGVVGTSGMTALSPPPRPTSTVNRFVQPLGPPTLPGVNEKQQQQEQEDNEQTLQPLQLPGPVESQSPPLPPPSSIAQQPQLAPASPVVTPRTPRQKTPKQTRLQQQHQNLPALELPPQHGQLCVAPEDSTSATSPRYVVYPPGPACYVFDLSQQEYLPSYVNMAARIEQKQNLKHSNTNPNSPHGSTPSTPSIPTSSTVAAGGARSHRIIVTGLGMEAITQSAAEIEAEKTEQVAATTTSAAASTQSPNAAVTTEPLDAFDLAPLPLPTSNQSACTLPATAGSRPQRVPIPSGSYFSENTGSPRIQPALGSPTGSMKSFMSRKSSDNLLPHSMHFLHQAHPHSPLGTEISPSPDDEGDDMDNGVEHPQPQRPARKPSMLKRKTSKLSLVTQSSHSLYSTGDIISPHTHAPSTPRSPYIGDF
ncbi:hypothetical protein BGX33_004271 [Mortierella sp. NVP41]|nr:hypothetical protein BGX33_004271 [Mortierella sp. NVP41]